jgi:hypothetical protein
VADESWTCQGWNSGLGNVPSHNRLAKSNAAIKVSAGSTARTLFSSRIRQSRHLVCQIHDHKNEWVKHMKMSGLQKARGKTENRFCTHRLPPIYLHSFLSTVWTQLCLLQMSYLFSTNRLVFVVMMFCWLTLFKISQLALKIKRYLLSSWWYAFDNFFPMLLGRFWPRFIKNVCSFTNVRFELLAIMHCQSFLTRSMDDYALKSSLSLFGQIGYILIKPLCLSGAQSMLEGFFSLYLSFLENKKVFIKQREKAHWERKKALLSTEIFLIWHATVAFSPNVIMDFWTYSNSNYIYILFGMESANCVNVSLMNHCMYCDGDDPRLY